MKLSLNGANFLKGRELGPDGKVALVSYKCQAGKWTIGWGHTGKDIVEWTTCTPQQAQAFFDADTERAISTVNDVLAQRTAAPLEQHRFDMLVSLCYNIGCANFLGSTLASLLRGGAAPSLLCAQFEKWVYVTRNGKHVVSAGLVSRRKLEAKIFSGGY